MPVDSIATPGLPAEPAARRRTLSDAATLLLRAAAPERRHLMLGTAWLVLAAGLEALGPLIGKFFLDNYLLPHRADLPAMGGLLLGALVAGMLASYLRYLQLARLAGLAMRSVQRIRENVYGHVLRLPMSFFDRAITGQLVSRVTNDTEAVKMLYVQVLFVMLDSLIVLAGAMTAMLWLDWRLMLIVATLVPAVVLIVMLYQRLSAPAVTRTRELRSELNAQLAESIAGMAVLQAGNATGRFSDRFRGINEAHYQSRQRELRANAWLLRPVLDLLNVILLAVVIFVFGMRSNGGALSALEVGVLYAFISYISRVVEPLIQITMQFSQLQQAMVGAARVHVLLREAETPVAVEQGRVTEGSIAIEHLDFAYRAGQPVLHDLNLHIAPGSFHGIVGHTGSGKSTLLSLLLRFYPAPAGTIRIDGTPVGAIGEDHFRDSVGLVPQEPFPAGGQRAREHRHGPPADRRASGGRRPRGQRARFHRGPGGRLRHAARRGRRTPLGRAEAAARDRAGARRRAAHPVPGRGHVAHRLRDRAGGAACVVGAARQGDDRGHRAPALDHPRRGPHRRPQPRPHRGARHPR
jgi:ATP-binding cassette, subfamily B, multidrug efflux pump